MVYVPKPAGDLWWRIEKMCVSNGLKGELSQTNAVIPGNEQRMRPGN